jgi:cellulose synthase/poly-beta-1,6-N-acetylglucosamine synthase-like glycosyltransferase
MIIILALWFLLQVIIGFNLVFPAILYFLWKLVTKKIQLKSSITYGEADYAIIVTAYQYTNTLPGVVKSLLSLDYTNYLIYIVADNCDISELNFTNDKVILLRPVEVLGSNTRSHKYAFDHFKRNHDFVTIIDSDNLVDSSYLIHLNDTFSQGYEAVQGLRAAKNLNSTLACLDAARDIYYHFYDGKLLYETGSSATLSGSGMAFTTSLYKDFLSEKDVIGAGFDKVLQSWILSKNKRIAFNEHAIVYDEKTSKSDQLVQQRSRWINTWFKYFLLGFDIIILGFKNFSRNQILFGTVLLRPPLFIFLFLSVVLFAINLMTSYYVVAILWLIAFLCFIAFFAIALLNSNTDKRIYRSLTNIPQFVFYQIASLLKSKNANKISVATKHYDVKNSAFTEREK